MDGADGNFQEHSYGSIRGVQRLRREVNGGIFPRGGVARQVVEYCAEQWLACMVAKILSSRKNIFGQLVSDTVRESLIIAFAYLRIRQRTIVPSKYMDKTTVVVIHVPDIHTCMLQRYIRIRSAEHTYIHIRGHT